MKTVVITASSRKEGNTSNLVKTIIKLSNWDNIDLLDYKISHFDYDHKNSSGDFLELITLLVNNYNHFVFATPVYWYTMSGVLKVFFDRITDLLTTQKQLGRQLRNKKISVVTSSTGDNLEDTFWIPFQKTAMYLGMEFIGGLHTTPETLNHNKISDFINKIKE